MSGIVTKPNRIDARADEGDVIIETLRLFENPSIHWEYTESHQWLVFDYFGYEAGKTINQRRISGDAFVTTDNIIMEELLALLFESGGCPEFPHNAYERLLKPVNVRHRHIEYFYGNPGFSEQQTVEVGAIRVLASFAVKMIIHIGAFNQKIDQISNIWTENRMNVISTFANIQQTGILGTKYVDYRKLALFMIREAIEWYNSLTIEVKEDMKHSLAMGRL